MNENKLTATFNTTSMPLTGYITGTTAWVPQKNNSDEFLQILELLDRQSREIAELRKAVEDLTFGLGKL